MSATTSTIISACPAMLVDTEYVDGEASTANVFVADGDEELGAVSAGDVST